MKPIFEWPKLGNKNGGYHIKIPQLRSLPQVTPPHLGLLHGVEVEVEALEVDDEVVR